MKITKQILLHSLTIICGLDQHDLDDLYYYNYMARQTKLRIMIEYIWQCDNRQYIDLLYIAICDKLEIKGRI